MLSAIVKLLLAAGANRDTGVNGMRPIDVARREMKPEVVTLLLQDGQTNWGSGQARTQPAGTTSKLHRAQVKARGGEEHDDAADAAFSAKQYKHRERLLKLKDEKHEK